MSWMKRRGQPSPNTTNSGVPMFNPNTHSNPQQPYQHQWQQNPQQYNNAWYNQSKGPSKTPPIQQQFPQQNTNNYWSQSYNQPQQSYNQTLPNQPNQFQYNQYGNNQHQMQPPANYYQPGIQQDGYDQQYTQQQQQQNYYPNQQQTMQSNNAALINPVPAQRTNQADPWNWDWDDTNANSQPQKEPVNQNPVTDSFANDESWNWSVDDSNSQNQNVEPVTSLKVEEVPKNLIQENNTVVKQEQNLEVYQQQQLPPVQKFDTLEDLPAIQRIKNENLTPQWSIESQVSQDSSEDVMLTSESDNRSNILSQSSTTSQSPSRPASTHDVQADFVPQYRYEQEPVQNQQPVENNLPLREEPINREYYQENSQSCIDNVDKVMQDLSLNPQFENKEIVSPENASLLAPPPTKEEMPLPVKEPTPPPLQNKMTPPLQPPPAIPSTSDTNKNPYKKGTGITHKSLNKVLVEKQQSISTIVSQNTEQAPPVFLQQSIPSAFSQPISTLRPADNLGVNLETLPDNSERPDQLPVENIPPKTVRKTSTVQQQWAENCEIAPINDRNQYLETGQLSDADVPVYNQSENAQGTSGDNNDSLPPPGLRRLVLGQMEQTESNQPIDNTLDEPPPGLSRMVLGSTALESKKIKPRTIPMNMVPTMATMANVFQPSSQNNEPPAGLHRMVPGESSSPESSSYMYRTDPNVFQPGNFDDTDIYVSESELNQMGVSLVSQRSATIGADTPPVTNQQNISTTGYSSSSSVDPIPSREGAVGIDNESKEADLSNISSTVDETISESNRREDIDGGPQEEIVAQVRDQTVGQNTTDIASSNNSNQNDKHRTRNYTTDSEHEQPKERHNRSSSPGGRYEKDRRYYDDRRDRPRDRDSPDSRYRGDKKYDKRRPKDRRYEEDTDYYSDKERRRDDREDYEHRYSSLRRDKGRSEKRDHRDYRDERDERRSEYYYNRYDADYYNRSRPSSRSESMHDSYRERNIRPNDRDRDRDHDRHRHRDRDHERDRDRDRDRHRRLRDPYNSYYQGFNYYPYYQQYQQQYHQYYENLRQTNPQAYAEWYRKYFQQQGGAILHAPGYSTEDRASVHSGRSSANEELSKDRYTRQSYYSQQSLTHYYREPQNASTVYTVDDSRLLDHTDSSLILEDTNVVSQRLTPAKFSTAHVKASIASGNLVNILPHYPLDGQPATIEILNLQSLLADDEDCKELTEFPGPLVKGVTHKKTVIDYCENKIKKATASSNIQDVESYILMWELLILLLRQNGMVVGTDIAELLMKNRPIESSRRQSVSSSSSTQHIDTLGEPTEHGTRVSPAMHYKEEFITDKFREYLIYGSGKEALEWAMKHDLWGHALFLASKLDKRTYANVMMRFANGLTMNDPLQTLYQLLSGRQPAAVTSVADEKWGDWRPHLAMILSNTSQRPDLDRKAITTLGDTLLQRGSLYAAHFCYLMSQVEFGRYNNQGVKLVLLSSSHTKPFNAFATNEAIFMTEIYEYCCTLSDNSFTIPEFQTYKYLMATRMVDHGLLEKGLSYLERVGDSIKQNPSRAKQSLVSRVCELADRLKYCDPVQEDGDLDTKADNTWLSDLKGVLKDYNMGLITHQSTSNLNSLETEVQQQIDQQISDQQWQQPQQQIDYYQQQQMQTQQDVQQPWQQQTDQQNLDYNQQQINYQQGEIQQANYDSTNYQNQYWNQQQQPSWEDNQTEINQQKQDDNLQNQQPQQNDYWNQPAQSEPIEQPKNPSTDDAPRPQISMPNQTRKTKNYFDDENESKSMQQKPASPVKSKPAPEQSKPASTGWFGGIWSNFSLRPKNQMKLPDDKNPTIVWDSEKKRWVNLEEDNNDTAQELKPPPSMADMFPNRATNNPGAPTGPQSLPTQMQNYNAQTNDSNATNPIPTATENQDDGPKPPSQSNMFKLQRGRNIKKAYVDVFNPGGDKSASKSSAPAPDVFGVQTPASSANQMNFFIPQPISDPNAPTDFLTPQLKTNAEENSQLSRWSSASSLSREVQFYMQRPLKQGGAPMMYNPNQFSN